MPSSKKPGKMANKIAASKDQFHLLTDAELENYLREYAGGSVSEDLGRAQELMYEAWDAGNKRSAVLLAKRAIKTCPLCSDAYVMLAEMTAKSPTDRRSLYEIAVKAAELALGPEGFKEYAEHFWGFHETRPYMRARAALAETLSLGGDHEEAASHYWEMLDLNPNDNQGIRYILAACLLHMNDIRGLKRLLKRNEDDGGAYMLYTQALMAYRENPDGKKAKQFAENAGRSNSHIPEGLAGTKKIVDPQTGYYTLGGEDEAAYYLEEFGFAWHETPGAIKWLVSVTKNVKPRSQGTSTLH